MASGLHCADWRQMEGNCHFSLGWVTLLLGFTWSKLGQEVFWGELQTLSWAGLAQGQHPPPSLPWWGSGCTQPWQAGILEGLPNHGGCPVLCKEAADLSCDWGTALAGCRLLSPKMGVFSPTAQQRQIPQPALPGSRSVCGARAHAVTALGYSSPVAGSAASSHPKLIALQSFQGTPTFCGS